MICHYAIFVLAAFFHSHTTPFFDYMRARAKTQRRYASRKLFLKSAGISLLSFFRRRLQALCFSELSDFSLSFLLHFLLPLLLR